MPRQMAFRPQFATKVLGSCSREPPTRICTSVATRGNVTNTMRAITQSGPCLILVTDCCMRDPRTKRGVNQANSLRRRMEERYEIYRDSGGPIQRRIDKIL